MSALPSLFSAVEKNDVISLERFIANGGNVNTMENRKTLLHKAIYHGAVDCVQLLLEKGGRNGTVIRLLCPLIITHDECVEAVSRFKKAIAEALVATRGA